MGIVSAKTCGTGIKNKKYGTGIKTKDTVQVLKQKDTVPVLKNKRYRYLNKKGSTGIQTKIGTRIKNRYQNQKQCYGT